jgi:hypothetical protein
LFLDFVWILAAGTKWYEMARKLHEAYMTRRRAYGESHGK